MILLTYDAALRREELMSLRVDDIDWAHGILTIRARDDEGRTHEICACFSGGLAPGRRYIEERPPSAHCRLRWRGTGPIFLSQSTRNPGRPLSTGAFDEIVEQVREKVGLPALTPHTLRHQRCTSTRNGLALIWMTSPCLAGHRSTETTRLYIHLAPSELSQADSREGRAV